MQATMNVQPLSFEDDRFYARTTTSLSSFSSDPQELQEFHEYSSGGGVSLARKNHPLLSFDEALDEDDLDEYDEDEEEEEEEEPRRRQYLTEEEYQREAADFTRHQLKQSGLYYKHAYHFWRLRSRDSFARVRPHLVKVLVAFVVLAIPIVLGLFLVEDTPFGAKTDVSMLPDLAQKKVPTLEDDSTHSGHGGLFLHRLLRRAGLKRDNETEPLVPAPLTTPALETISSPAAAAAQPKEEAKEPEGEVINHIGVYEEPGLSFTSILPTQGMNIFSFAYNAAFDFLYKTFGWESNSTTTAQ